MCLVAHTVRPSETDDLYMETFMLSKLRAAALSPYFTAFIFLMSATAYFFGDTAIVACMIAEALIVALLFCVSDDLSPALFPILAIILLGTTLIGRTGILIPYVPFAYPAIAAFVLHLVLYKRRVKLKIGVSFIGVAVAGLAVLLSGLGNRDTINYLDPTTIYYTLMMSVGLVLLYFLFAVEVKREVSYDRIRYFMTVLLFLGALASIVVAYHFIRWISGEAGGREVYYYYLQIPFRNTIANLLILCLPAPFYFAGYALKHRGASVLSFLLGALFYGAMLMTVARTAMLFGTILLIVCLVYYLRGRGGWFFKIISVLIVVAGVSIFVFSIYEPLLELFSSRLEDGLASVGEARWELFVRSLSDFLEHPIFGIGFASTSNADIYAADGCVSWYHLYFPQIWGGLGLVGCLAFGYQLLLRLKLALYRPNSATVAVALSYLGILL